MGVSSLAVGSFYVFALHSESTLGPVGVWESCGVLLGLFTMAWGAYYWIQWVVRRPETLVAVGPDRVAVFHLSKPALDFEYRLAELRWTKRSRLSDLFRTTPRERVLESLVQTRAEAQRCADYIDSLIDNGD